MASIIILAPVGGTSNGADIAMNHQMTHLRSLGHAVTLVTRTEHTAEFAEFLAGQGIASRVLDYGWWSDLADDGMAKRDAETVGTLATILAETPFDVAITNTVHMPWLALAAAGAGVPHLWLIHEFPVGQFAATRDTYPFLAAYSTEILAASPLLARELAPRVGATPVSHLLPYTATPRLAAADGDGAPRLVSVNHVSEGKNTLELVKVFEHARQEVPDLTLDIRGGVLDEAYLAEVQAYIADHGLGGVTFSSDPGANWAGVHPTDVVVHTSHFETFSLTLVETLKAGVAVVAAANSATDALTDLGFLNGPDIYPAGDIAAAAARIVAKLADPAATCARAEATAASVRENLTLARVSQPLVDAIERAGAPRQPELQLVSALARSITGIVAERDAWADRARSAEAAHETLLAGRTWRTAQAILRPVRALRRRTFPRG